MVGYRRDKYQRHVLEYWIDVRTSGSLSKASREEFSQHVEIIDDNLQLPAPQLGNECLPCYDEEDDDDDGDDDDDCAEPKEDKTSTVTPKGAPRKRGKTPSPKSKLLSKRKREKEEEVESALEDSGLCKQSTITNLRKPEANINKNIYYVMYQP